MSIAFPDRSASRLTARPWARSAPALLLAAVVGLSGCAPIHGRPAPQNANRAIESESPESSALPSTPEPEIAEPPSSSAEPGTSPTVTRVLVVKATAYNSRRNQTDSTPSIAAWGDRLRPGMKVIAVSRDLLELGLSRGQRVEIVGLEGEYVVLDKMPSRWRQKIDIYMGNDVRAARNWGVREVEIRWQPDPEDLGIEEAFEAAGGVVETAN